MHGDCRYGWEIWERATFENEIVKVWEMKYNLETKKFREGNFGMVGEVKNQRQSLYDKFDFWIEDQNGFFRSQGGPPEGGGVSLSSGHSVTHIQLNDQFSCGNDYALKVRKPYTITKQRERWTDEEHKNCMDGLGDVLKVLHDPTGNNTNTVESIEIPPPRPKRKPMHPYPRKLVETPNKEISIPEQPMKSNSLKSSDFDQENQSPKSVLSGVGSDSLGSSDSDTPNGSLSPMSSISGFHTSSFTRAKPKTTTSEEEAGMDTDSTHDEKPLMKFKLPPNGCVSIKEDNTAEESSGRTFKLFGMTLFVTDTCKPSPTIEEC
ncbi:Protein REVEILLE 1 [Glycine max]|nr:Protein REVEILLE 1 [Glycine max]